MVEEPRSMISAQVGLSTAVVHFLFLAPAERERNYPQGIPPTSL